MPRDHISVAAPPDRVFAVLADGRSYGDWVVGTRSIPHVDDKWPEPGSSLRYVVGVGPLQFSDRTRVVAARRPYRLELVAGAGRLPAAAITIELANEGSGTRVTLDERPAQRLLALALGPVGHLAISLRNRRALRRLKALAEAR